MAWLRLDDGFTEHRKLVSLKRSERWTWLEVLTYCARQSNGGHIPEGICDVLRWVTPTFLTKCVNVGLLDAEDGGYFVHDWHIYNPKDPTGAARQMRHRNTQRNAEITAPVTSVAVTEVTPRAQPRARVPSPTPKEQTPSSFLPELQDVEGGTDGTQNEIDELRLDPLAVLKAAR